MEFNATFLVSIISFLVFVYLMNKVFYIPVTNIIEERENLVNETLNAAKNSRDKASQLLAERDNKLNQAAEDSKKLVNASIENANSKSKEMTQNAKTSSLNEIGRKKSELAEENDAVKSQLDNTVKNLAEEISSKILGYKSKISG